MMFQALREALQEASVLLQLFQVNPSRLCAGLLVVGVRYTLPATQKCLTRPAEINDQQLALSYVAPSASFQSS